MEYVLVLAVLVAVGVWAIMRSRRRLEDFSRSRREDEEWGEGGPRQDWRDR